MSMLDLFDISGLYKKPACEIALKEANELKRLKAQEQRMIGMLGKYTDLYQRGKNKAMIINVINDLDKVLGVKPDGK